jgi:TatD DNase family protein
VIDTHAHLELAGTPDILARAAEAGVDRVIAVATSVDGAAEALELTRRHPGVFASLGIHPHDAGGEDRGRLGELRELLRDERAVAVGETGLDYFRDYAPRDAQRRLFDAQLDLAAELGKPVVIHTRAADDDTLAALAGFDGTVVLHCFSSPGLLDTALERGWYCSFAGNVTYPKAPELRAAARLVPADRLLAETDSPYLAPQPVRGRRNESAFVMHTLATLAEVRGEDAAGLGTRIDANATAAFELPPPGPLAPRGTRSAGGSS